MPTFKTRLGTWGEEVAGRFLQKKGYELVANNYRCAYGEVDIVAKDGDELVFVEVRTRRGSNFGTPEESITRHKLQRLLATCQEFVQQHDLESAEWRADLVTIHVVRDSASMSNPRINHLQHILENY